MTKALTEAMNKKPKDTTDVKAWRHYFNEVIREILREAATLEQTDAAVWAMEGLNRGINWQLQEMRRQAQEQEDADETSEKEEGEDNSTMRMNKVRELANKWMSQGPLGEDDIRGLTPKEASMVAHLAGYNTNHQIHVMVRQGCAELARSLQA